MMDYDGKNRRIIAESGPIKHPFALTVFEDYVYFTDWAPESIRRINRLHGGSKHIFKNDLKKPMAIQVLHPGRQPKNQKTVNYCKNSKCSHLCVLKPKGYSCKCPFGFTLRHHDNKTCESKYCFHWEFLTLSNFIFLSSRVVLSFSNLMKIMI